MKKTFINLNFSEGEKMNTTIKLALSLLFVFSFSISNSFGLDKQGTTGKITGKVIDAKDKAPLIGATIKVEGTNSGAVTDDNGEFTILNMDVGTYSVTASYIGYDPQTTTDVKVSADLTTTVNFSLKVAGSEITTDEIEIVGKRNAISPDGSGKIIGQEFIDNSGLRGIENIAATTAGVVQDENGANINIRGGRDNETAIIIDGVVTNNPLDGTSTSFVSNSVLEELAVLTGGFSAEYGNVMSGVINVTTKGGTDKFSGSIEGITDEFVSNNVSQGYNVYNASLGGPLIPTKKLSKFANFYGGFERDFSLVANPSWISDQLEIPNNVLPNNTLQRWSGNGKLNIDLQELNKKLPIQLKFGMSLANTDRTGYLQAYYMFNSARNAKIVEDNNQYYGKINHQVNSKLFYELQFNYFDASYSEADPQFGSSIYSYGDPNKVQGLTIPGGQIGLDEYNVFAKYNRVRNYYEQSAVSYWSTTLNLTTQLKSNEIKFGGQYLYNTIRYIDLRPVGMYNLAGKSPQEQLDGFNGGIALANYYGYAPVYNSATGLLDIVENDDGFDGSKHPIVASLYLQDKVEFKDFTLNAGLRWDYLDANSWGVKDLTNIAGPNGVLGPDDFVESTTATTKLSPRIGLSFPVTNNTIFHAQYGNFIQLPSLEFLYNGRENLEYWVNSAGFSGSFGNPNLQPEETIAYELGIKQQVGDKLAVDVTAYYKETEGLIGIRKYPQLPNQIQVFENNDYGTVRGVDLSLDLRRTNRLSLNIALGVGFASGTGSDPNSASTAAWLGERQPKLTAPLDYDQRYTGVINADYRFGTQDVPKGFWGDVLSQFGVNLLYSFNSGRPYSIKSNSSDPFVGTGAGASLLSTINGANGPWNNRLDLRIDKTIPVWKLDFDVYVYIVNLLNSELVNDVWAGSGLPGSTGFLDSEPGKTSILSYNNPNGTVPTTSEEYVRRYTLRSRSALNYGPPRQYRFGIRMNF
ncbi:MAG: TonB-dependent receptor [Bacteroidota bacterium]|nr:TonB-dependent receptor [Bacteroidota bacterium]